MKIITSLDEYSHQALKKLDKKHGFFINGQFFNVSGFSFSGFSCLCDIKTDMSKIDIDYWIIQNSKRKKGTVKFHT